VCVRVGHEWFQIDLHLKIGGMYYSTPVIRLIAKIFTWVHIIPQKLFGNCVSGIPRSPGVCRDGIRTVLALREDPVVQGLVASNLGTNRGGRHAAKNSKQSIKSQWIFSKGFITNFLRTFCLHFMDRMPFKDNIFKFSLAICTRKMNGRSVLEIF
jgi:hypothetical protein